MIGRRVGVSLLALGFALAAGRVVFRAARSWTSDERVLSFAHTQLGPAPRAAFSELARRYEQRNPGARVNVIELPPRQSLYDAWLLTQMTGETAPDIFAGRTTRRDDPAFLSRYILPLSPYVDTVNPYNEGTPLAGRSWRSTFIEELSTAPLYNAELMDYFFIPTEQTTGRYFYNRDLLIAFAGTAEPPSNFRDFVELCRSVQAGGPGLPAVMPIAADRGRAGMAYYLLLVTLTQRLALDLDHDHNLHTSEYDAGLAYLRGEWDFDTPAIRAALETRKTLSKFMPQGVDQWNEEDAIFQFAQGNALMFPSGAWSLPTLREVCSFPVVIGDLVTPSSDDPEYGRFVLGRRTELSMAVGNTWGNSQSGFGVNRRSPHPDLAVDFLKFITSWESIRYFSEAASSLPPLVDIPISGMKAKLMPVSDGYNRGFYPNIYNVGSRLAGNWFSRNEHLLRGADGDVGKFVDRVAPEYRRLLLQDYRTEAQNRRKAHVTYEPRLGWLLHRQSDDDGLGESLDRFLERECVRDSAGAQLEYTLTVQR